MNRANIFSLLIVFLLNGCMPVKSTINNQYKLDSYSKPSARGAPLHRSLLISQPEALAGYQTEQMLYIDKPYEINAFAQSAWISSPANMLYPLLIQSFQESHAFSASASSPYSDKVDYRLDTQLISLQQNFLFKPSVLEFTAKVVITRVEDNHVLASELIRERIPCKMDTPYGGVVAANKATEAFTREIRRFAIQKIQRDTTHNHGQTSKMLVQ